MIFPYSTDAPIYHLPIATVGLIAVNTAVYVGMGVAGVDFYGVDGAQQWCLQYGVGLKPMQWLTSIFIHWDFMHLAGNMFFLWTFGLVTEGKLGWWKFLACYLAVGAGQSGIEQAIMAGDVDGYSLGASAAIFGIIGMALVWAPRNEVSCFFLLNLSTFDLSILAFAFAYFCWEGLMFALSDFGINTAALHLMGGGLGFGLGIVLFKAGMVDCEGWDLFAVLAGDEGGVERTRRRLKEKEQRRQEEQIQHAQQQNREQRVEEAGEHIGLLLSQGNSLAAGRLYQKFAAAGKPPDATAEGLAQMIDALESEGPPGASIRLMAQYVKKFPETSAPVRLRLAQGLIEHQHRPTKALEVLAEIPEGALDDEGEELRRRLIDQATALQEAGELELEGDDF